MSRVVPKDAYDEKDPMNVKLTRDQVYRNMVYPINKNTAPFDKVVMEHNNATLVKQLDTLFENKSTIFSNEVYTSMIVLRDAERLLKYEEMRKYLDIPSKESFDYWVSFFLNHELEDIISLGKLVVEEAMGLITRYLSHAKNELLLERIYRKGSNLQEWLKYYHAEFKLLQGETPIGGLSLDRYKEIIEKVRPILVHAPENRR